MYHNIVHIKNPTRCNSVSKFISYLYEAQHVSGDTPPIMRSLKLHYQPLDLHAWKAVGRVVAGRCQSPATTRPTTLHLCKIRGFWCSFRLLMMGCVSLETCWASYKYRRIKFWYIVAFCWIFFMNFTMTHGSMNIKCKNCSLYYKC
jgi:hypothetical protein